MKIICKKTDAKNLNLKDVTTIYSNDYDYSFGGYGLELNKTYIVMGMVMYYDSKCLYYLVDTNGTTNWFPYMLFDIINNSLPSGWFFKLNNENINSDISCLWGFDELCNIPEFYDMLSNRNEEALRIYFRRKINWEKAGV